MFVTSPESTSLEATAFSCMYSVPPPTAAVLIHVIFADSLRLGDKRVFCNGEGSREIDYRIASGLTVGPGLLD